MDTAMDFEWEAAPAGYTVADSEDFRGWNGGEITPGAYLVERQSPHARGHRPRVYRPMRDYPGLFMAFATGKSPELGEEGANEVGFANHHGLLGLQGPGAGVAFLASAGGQAAALPARAESVLGWLTERFMMKFAVLLWRAVEAGDAEALARRLAWSEDQQTVLVNAHAIESPVPIDQIPRVVGRFTPGDLFGPATYLVRTIVNDQLDKHAKLALGFSEANQRLHIQLAPRDLLGAMWLQFAQMIDEGKKAQRCPECGKWFLISLDTKPGYKLFDSDACRAAAYRRRKEARHLAGEGMSAEDIAKQLGRDVETVKGWLNLPDEPEEPLKKRPARRKPPSASQKAAASTPARKRGRPRR